MAAELPVVVPGPVDPADRDAWYAPAVSAQYPVAPGVVATVREIEDGYHYRTREPALTVEERAAFVDIRDFVEGASRSRPRTRDDAVERMEAGLSSRWKRLLDRRGPASRASCRRVGYYLAARLRALGELTPLALDDRIRIADASGDRIVVHTNEFAPVETDFSPATPFLDRFLRERLATYTVPFEGFEIPVTVFRRRLLGADTFDLSYAVAEPERFPGDEVLVTETKRHIRQSPPQSILDDPEAAVERRARTLLRRQIFRRESDWLKGTLSAVANLLPIESISRSPPPFEARRDRIHDLTYYVLRDLIGDGPLTIPIRDPNVEAVEANRIGERVKVVARNDAFEGTARMPSTVSIDDERAFLGLARKLAAEGGHELSTRHPSGTVELVRGSGAERRILQCAVGLPAVGDDGPYISVRSRPAEPATPTKLLDRDRLTVPAVAAVWMVAETKGAVLFVGPANADPADVMSAHTPFIPAEARPVSVNRSGTPVDLPHETGISLRATPAGSRNDRGDGRRDPRERTALHPDVEILPDVSDANGFERLAAALGTGRGVFAASTLTDRGLLVDRASDAGLSPTVFGAIDLVVSLSDPASAHSAELWVPTVERRTAERWDGAGSTFEPGRLRWEPVRVSEDEEESEIRRSSFVRRLAELTGRDRETLGAEFVRRRRYVEYMRRANVTERSSLVAFLADLRTDEPATIERIQQVLDA